MVKFDIESFWLAAGCGVAVGLIAGGFISYQIVDSTSHDFVTKDELMRTCIAGNERACKIYEVDYGRK